MHSLIMIMKLKHRPIIGWGLGYQDWIAPKCILALRRLFLKRFYQLFDALVAYSSKGSRDYVQLGIESKRVFVAENAVSSEQAQLLYEEFSRSPNLIKDWKCSLGISEKPIVLYVGRLLPQKRVGDLIRACAQLPSSCELLIVGDGSERTHLEAIAGKEFPATKFLGYRSGRELALCFANADLFVLPGTGGLSIQEAMIYGKPVIVAAGDGSQSDLVQKGVNGLSISPGDVSGLVRAIQNCLQDPEKLRRMGHESRRIIQRHVNMRNMVRTFCHVLSSVSPPSKSETE